MTSSGDPQPAPVLTASSVEVLPFALKRLEGVKRIQGAKLLIDSLIARAVKGERKYKVTLHSFNGRDCAVDAFEEAQDAVMYLNQKLMEADVIDSVHVTELLHLAEDLALGIAYYIDKREKARG